MATFAVSSIRCPKCGALEMHPDGDKLLIRGFKVCSIDGYWWSQCLVCSGGYNADLSVFTQANSEHNKGWF